MFPSPGKIAIPLAIMACVLCGVRTREIDNGALSKNPEETARVVNEMLHDNATPEGSLSKDIHVIPSDITTQVPEIIPSDDILGKYGFIVLMLIVVLLYLEKILRAWLVSMSANRRDRVKPIPQRRPLLMHGTVL